jgi:23S rRNA (uridine2552-2'-O)-methyltransferase
MARMNRHFRHVKHAKPPSSRQDSKEWFVVAQGFRRHAPSADTSEADTEDTPT